MIRKLLRRAVICVLCVVLLPANVPARASDSLQTTGHEIVGGIVAVTAAIVVVAVILVVHYKPATVKGCVASGPNGLELTNSSEKVTYELAGATSDIKPGQLVLVKGKKKSGKGGANSTFTVKELSKDYGACPAHTNPQGLSVPSALPAPISEGGDGARATLATIRASHSTKRAR